jgi:hypothetical protein
MSIYKAEYDTRLLYTQNYTAEEGLNVTTDMFAVMWTYAQAISPTTARIRLTYIYTKESTGIAPVQGILEQWKSEGWVIIDEFCDGFTDFRDPEDFRYYLMQMIRAFLLGVPIGAEVEGDSSPTPVSPKRTGLKPKTGKLKSRIKKMMNKPGDKNNDETTDESDDIFASGRIIKSKIAKPKSEPDDDDTKDDDDDDDGWL